MIILHVNILYTPVFGDAAYEKQRNEPRDNGRKSQNEIGDEHLVETIFEDAAEMSSIDETALIRAKARLIHAIERDTDELYEKRQRGPHDELDEKIHTKNIARLISMLTA